MSVDHCAGDIAVGGVAAINTQLERARAAEEAEGRLREASARLGEHVDAFYRAAATAGPSPRGEADSSARELLFQVDTCVRAARRGGHPCPGLWAAAVQLAVAGLLRRPLVAPTVGGAEGLSPWRLHLRRVAAAGDGGHPRVAPTVRVCWDAAFALVACLPAAGGDDAAVMAAATADMLAVTVQQLQAFADGTARTAASLLSPLRRPGSGDTLREALLRELSDDLLFLHQLWWWHDTKWRPAAAAAPVELAEAVAALATETLRDAVAVGSAVLQCDTAAAVAAPSVAAVARVTEDCQIVTQAVAALLQPLPAAAFAALLPSDSFGSGDEAAEAVLQRVLHGALHPITTDALEHADEWFTAPTPTRSAEGEGPTTRKEALRAVLTVVEEHWSAAALRASDVVPTLRQLAA